MTALEPAESPGFLLWRATLRWQRAVAGALAPLELTHVQFVLLASTWWLNQQGERPNQHELAEHASTDEKMTSEVIRGLERNGLIERELDPHDTRAKKVQVTTRGARLAPRAIAAVEQVDSAFFASVPSNAALDLLRQLAAYPRS
jgi:DNA-binding MarR family transcriptional regulator